MLATQNPIELEGTFPLPEAQLDRFLLRVRLGYPGRGAGGAHPHDHAGRSGGLPTDALAGVPAIRDLQDLVGERRARASRPPLHRVASRAPRASIPSCPWARARAPSSSSATPRARGPCSTAATYVLPDDVKLLAEPVLAHRLVPTTDARIRDRTADEILREVLRSVPVPTEFREG